MPEVCAACLIVLLAPVTLFWDKISDVLSAWYHRNKEYRARKLEAERYEQMMDNIRKNHEISQVRVRKRKLFARAVFDTSLALETDKEKAEVVVRQGVEKFALKVCDSCFVSIPWKAKYCPFCGVLQEEGSLEEAREVDRYLQEGSL